MGFKQGSKEKEGYFRQASEQDMRVGAELT